MRHSRTLGRREGFTFLLLAAGLLAVLYLACSNARDIPEGFYKVQPGWSKSEVLELLGEPGQVTLPPFETSKEDECKRTASSKLIFEHDEHNSLVVYLDEGDQVLCVYNRFKFMEH